MAEREESRFFLTNNYFRVPYQFGKIYLLQLGRLFSSAGQEIPEHCQRENWIELTIVRNGEGSIYTNGVATAVKKGDIYCSFPNDRHALCSSQISPLEFDFITFYTTDITYKKQLEEIIENHSDPQSRIIRNDNIVELIEKAIHYLDDQRFMSKRLMRNILEMAVIYLIREFSVDTKEEKLISPDDIDMFCYSIMKYIDEHLFELKNLKDLEDIFNYSYAYMSAVFTKRIKQSISDYYANKKFEMAQKLLKEKRMSISEIALVLNYSSIYTFSRAYKQRYGYSPKNEK